MTVFTEDLSLTSSALPYGGTATATRNLTVGDTITASFDQEATSTQQTNYLDNEDNDIFFTLVNCTISPTSVKNRGTFTITPTTTNSNYSCNGVLVYYLPGGHNYGGPSTNHQQAEFTISGTFSGSSGTPNMGLQVWSPSNTSLPRLDTKDKQIMHYASYSGTVTSGTATTISVGGGYDITNGDWGIDVTPVDYDLSVVSTSNQFVVSSAEDSIQWRVNVFKLNQS